VRTWLPALLLLLAPAAATAKKKKAEVVNLFQLGGVVWVPDYYSHLINGLTCVAHREILLCGPDWMEAGEKEFLAWARFVRDPERYFRARDNELGTGVLAAVTFERGLKAPEYVFYWQGKFTRNLYLRLPWPWTSAALDAWVRGEGRDQYRWILEHEAERVLNPVNGRDNYGQYTYASLKQGRKHSAGETKVVFRARPQAKPPQEPPLKLTESTIESLVDTLKGEQARGQKELEAEKRKRTSLDEEAEGAPDPAFIDKQRKVEDLRIDALQEALRRTQTQIETLRMEPATYCADCD
jgi:hypothetical protein